MHAYYVRHGKLKGLWRSRVVQLPDKGDRQCYNRNLSNKSWSWLDLAGIGLPELSSANETLAARNSGAQTEARRGSQQVSNGLASTTSPFHTGSPSRCRHTLHPLQWASSLSASAAASNTSQLQLEDARGQLHHDPRRQLFFLLPATRTRLTPYYTFPRPGQITDAAGFLEYAPQRPREPLPPKQAPLCL